MDTMEKLIFSALQVPSFDSQTFDTFLLQTNSTFSLLAGDHFCGWMCVDDCHCCRWRVFPEDTPLQPAGLKGEQL